MKRLLLASMAFALAAATQSQAPKALWELGKTPIATATVKGNVELVGGVLKLDTSNEFEIPSSILGGQRDYTIEFEFKCGDAFKALPRKEGALRIISNLDTKGLSGLALIYLPTAWNSTGGISNQIGMSVNGYWNDTCQGLVGNGFNKYTVVVKDCQMSIYRDGLLLAMTGEVKPSPLPLSVGGQGWCGNAPQAKEEKVKPVPVPYELRNLKIYGEALAPTGYDPSTSVMRNVCGQEYTMQRANIKDQKLPRLLVVGDSISMGYRRYITEHFKDRAYVDYWVGGKWFTSKEARDADSALKKAWTGVLSNGPYDVISWNSMTLHMWTPKQPERCQEDSHADNMAAVIEHIKKSSPESKILWIRCTPYTKADKGASRIIDEELSARLRKFNMITDEVVSRYGIPEVDLYSFCERNPAMSATDGVHWKAEAYKLMAVEICNEIEKLLPQKNPAQ